MATVSQNSKTTGALGVLGVKQSAGVAIAVLGLAFPKRVLVRDDVGRARVTIGPVLCASAVGLAGAFLTYASRP